MSNESELKLGITSIEDILNNRIYLFNDKNENYYIEGIELSIPEYQRPYTWTEKNVQDIFDDFEMVIENKTKYGEEFEYRLGTLILHCEDNVYKIVDGQQRITTLSLIYHYIDNTFSNFIIDKQYNKHIDKITIQNIYNNYSYIRNYLLNDVERKECIEKLFKDNLKFVVIVVDKLSEAFQLFDSQNSRGKDLHPHDLLKAYHLREMKENKSEKMSVVKKWESLDDKDVYNLFNDYLYPIYNWINKEKAHVFTKKDIDIYKGVKSDLGYNFALKLLKSEPIFQLDDFFISGKAFFDYVNYYKEMLEVIKKETANISEKIYGKIEELKNNNRYSYSINLFYAILLCYYDKFNKLDKDIILFFYKWSFQIRCDMKYLGYATINKYSIGELNEDYTNNIAMFKEINKSKNHKDLFKLNIDIKEFDETDENKKYHDYYHKIFNGIINQKEL